ncbi:hypothetical protein [Sphingobacterium suaedae]|uniref:Uncharacterized protein n=1 Tax=Sphingobacterium suaedae TaxID=1686402 RepID=A0ABW5KJ29_9SPHI
MENFLPALLIIGGVIYKIYSEFQKEQEKARRRQPHIPVPVPPPAPQTKTVAAPLPPKPAPPVIAKRKEERVNDYPEEVQQIREKRKAEKKTKTGSVQIQLEETESNATVFDLRQAVIQSAILHRPHA